MAQEVRAHLKKKRKKPARFVFIFTISQYGKKNSGLGLIKMLPDKNKHTRNPVHDLDHTCSDENIVKCTLACPNM